MNKLNQNSLNEDLTWPSASDLRSIIEDGIHLTYIREFLIEEMNLMLPVIVSGI